MQLSPIALPEPLGIWFSPSQAQWAGDCPRLQVNLFKTVMVLCLTSSPFPSGHSHQLFHICAVLGTHFQLEAVLVDMGSRRAWLTMQEPTLGLEATMATLSLAVIGNLFIIAAFTASLLRSPGTCPLLQGGPLGEELRTKQK